MSKHLLYTSIAVAIAIAVVSYFFFGLNPSGVTQNLIPQQNMQGQQNANAVVIQDVKVGTGQEAATGSRVSVSYIGKLQNGSVFDQSSSHGGPFEFQLGAGQVIPGWEQGIAGMKVGGERILIVPPSLGYGSQQVGPIPPNSTLIFDVVLVGISSTSVPVGAEGPAAN